MLRRKRIRPSTPSSLVKFARRAASVRTGRGQLHADERPGAARDVGEAVGGGGHAGHGRGGVVRAHRGDHDAGRQAQPLPQLGPHRSEDRPRRDQRGEQLGPRAPGCDQLERPLAGTHVEQPRGGCVGALGAQLAGQPVGQQVGQQGDGCRLRPQRAAALARQLVKGGEREELQPVEGEELVGRHEGVDRVHHLGRAVVAVATWARPAAGPRRRAGRSRRPRCRCRSTPPADSARPACPVPSSTSS